MGELEVCLCPGKMAGTMARMGWTNTRAASLASTNISLHEPFEEKMNLIAFDGDTTAHKG